MFIKADDFFAQLAIFRLLWIRGRLGGGKTLLSFAIAQEMLKRGIVDGVISNVPHALPLPEWRELMPDGRHRLIRGSCIVFDEAWTVLDNRTSMANDRSYGAFARKLETYWLFPSVIPIDKRVSYLSCERSMRLSIPIIAQVLSLLLWLPIIGALFKPFEWLSREFWIYRWTVELGYISESGWFILGCPDGYFGLYDTKYVPMDDGDISNLWRRTIEELKADEPEQENWYEEVRAVTDQDGNVICSEGPEEYSSKVREALSTISLFEYWDFLREASKSSNGTEREPEL